MTQEDKEFFAELAQELRTQDNCGYLNPIWCIMDKKWVVKPEGCGDEYRVVDCDGEEWTLSDFADYAFDCFSHRGDISLNDVKEEIMSCTDNEDLRSTLENRFKEVNFYEKYRIVEVSLEEFIAPDTTGFLTMKSAKEHLCLNSYHYSPYAKVYVLSAWRNPVYERVIEIIKNTNWEEE
jgi:hypothetical protein